MIQPATVWPALHEAQRAVLIELIVRGSQPRVELARTLGLSRTSLTRLTKELMELGFIEEGESQLRASRGRPPELIDVVKDSAHFFGVKLTGDALYAVVTNLGSEVVDTREVPLVDRDVASVVQLIARTSEEMLAAYPRPGAIGVCLAGDVEAFDGVDHIIGSSFLGWDDPVPLARLVSQATGLPATVSNDVQALTAAHHWFGVGVGRRSLVVIAVGAGSGSGIVVADDLVTGAHARQGKIGHIIIDAEGDRRCPLGHRGCAGALVSMPGIAQNAGAGANDYAEVLERARGGDERASAAFRDAATSLGAITAQFVNVLDPEKVIITGEGIDMVELARGRFEQSYSDHLDARAARDVEIDVHAFQFAHYAWGAAITAIRARV
ncbi:MAG: ROK family transcriptional regulator [Microbacteriaceae bacterium]